MRYRLPNHDDANLCFSPNSSLLAAAAAHQPLRLLGLDGKAHEVALPVADFAFQLRFSPSGRLLAVAMQTRCSDRSGTANDPATDSFQKAETGSVPRRLSGCGLLRGWTALRLEHFRRPAGQRSGIRVSASSRNRVSARTEHVWRCAATRRFTSLSRQPCDGGHATHSVNHVFTSPFSGMGRRCSVCNQRPAAPCGAPARGSRSARSHGRFQITLAAPARRTATA